MQSGEQSICFQVTGALLSGARACARTHTWQANSRLRTGPRRESLGMALRCFGLLTVGFSIIYSYQPSTLENARFKTLTCQAKRFPPTGGQVHGALSIVERTGTWLQATSGTP